MTRLGVGSALIAGQWIKGDVDVVEGRLSSVGLSPAVGTSVVVSGFVDRQINGFAGVDFRYADEAGYARAADALLATGVTRFNPTFYSSTIERYSEALGVLGELEGHPPAGAKILGAHLEGPFLSKKWKGAHDPLTLVDPSVEIVERFVNAGPIALMTVAPELPSALGLIRTLSAQGIRVSVGHTDASGELCREAFDAGATMITHCMNAHRRFSTRDPGPAAAALVDDRVTIGLIADGVHVGDDALRLVFGAASGRVNLVTDAIAPAGTGLGEWVPTSTRTAETFESKVVVADGAARLTDGTLAGSVATMDACVRHLLGLGLPSETVIAAAGGNRLRPGRSVDLIVMDDQWRVTDVFM